MPQHSPSLKNNPFILPIYAPTLLISFCRGLLIPVMPLFVRDFGVSYGWIGLVLAGESLGMLIADLPAGVLLHRLGRKRSMAVGLSLTAVATLALFWATSIPEALIYRLISGFGLALFNLSRHLYMAEMIQLSSRGRAIALLGGVNRIGVFLGPVIGGTVGAKFGLRIPFLIYGAMAALALLLVAVFVARVKTAVSLSPASHNLFQTIATHYRILAAAGMGQLFAQTIRAGRGLIIPLIGADLLGLDVQAIGLIISIASAIDMSLFYPAGWIMDRFGRKYAIVPSFLIQATGMALLPIVGGFGSLLLVSSLISVGNGLSSGTMMTIGADLAPTADRSQFLGSWRFIGDGGFTLGPLIVGAVADLLLLQTAALAMAGCGILAAGIFARFVPETAVKR
ncbi:MAG: MFS transporter [Chloroflexi bacterium]|nr:MFS transporter [Chloroflexota bacterium]